MSQYVPVDSHEEWQARRDQGIASSAQHAEQDVPGWGEYALAYVRWFAKSRAWKGDFVETAEGKFFVSPGWTMEECRQWAYSHGLAKPAEERAFGSVTQKAIRQGIIRKTGQYAPAASSNGSPKPLYVGT